MALSQLPKIARTGTTQHPAANFDRLARFYRWMELFTFGPYLARCRRAFLPECATCKHALALGDGDGRFTAQLLRTNPAIQIDAVDVSLKMLESLRRKTEPYQDRVRAFCADIRNYLPSNGPYDLVVAHFFLDCLEPAEVLSLAIDLQESLTTNAVWVISDFAVPRGWVGRLAGRSLVSFLYCAFGALTGLAIRELPNHAAALRQAGFILNRRQRLLRGLLISELWMTNPNAQLDPQCCRSVKIEAARSSR